ncbi:hypothetical protein CONLIGDRAFT_459556 [Coniochaeta ligniaria NRRL 30616]|uniref:Uncharacterized protein n=1 Tax=Coniochaeta ligniaria NRRL 30616 TaxID=1408157 RepID=A0A1J7JFK0_9PEZI|nr:hypothetical protein CONLIGDRAFT_459556 [Coniochaeta ligniaria NRRL 30616]
MGKEMTLGTAYRLVLHFLFWVIFPFFLCVSYVASTTFPHGRQQIGDLRQFCPPGTTSLALFLFVSCFNIVHHQHSARRVRGVAGALISRGAGLDPG